MNNCFDVLYENLIYLRKANCLTQKDMAQICHISVGAIRRLEKGEMPPRLGIDFVFCIQQHFGIPPEKLFGTPLWNTSAFHAAE